MIRDDFAGPGGWDVALRNLGRTDVVGIESDTAACATARAAGHHRLQADVLTLATDMRLDGYIASPPCQTFSPAGGGAGRRALDHLLAAIDLVADEGMTPQAAVEHVHDEALDVRSVLVLHPLTVIRDSRPTFVALEQVAAVQPVWDAYAEHLRAWGYSVATGKVQAEQYGVPQTRRRAVLIAHLHRQMVLPAPTHTRYVKGKPRQAGALLPWVSMSDALGVEPGTLVGFPRRDDGRESVTIDGAAYRARDLRPADQPAQVVTEKIRSWQMLANNADRVNDGSHPRTLDQPAQTLSFGHNAARVRWAPTAAVPGDTSWTDVRPSPTIVGSFSPDVVAAPGWRKAGDGPRQSQPGSVRVTVQEAAVLQTFPADYPWQGSRTAQFQQVGNAIPPLLAQALLQQVL